MWSMRWRWIVRKEPVDITMWMLALTLSACMGVFWGSLFYFVHPMVGLVIGCFFGFGTFAVLARLIYRTETKDDDDDWTNG
jgi:hypothetical protein